MPATLRRNSDSVVTSTSALAEAEARADRFRAEGGEQRRDHGAVLQRAERADVELGHASGEEKQPVSLAHAEAAQHVGEAVRRARELRVGHRAQAVVAADEAEGGAIAHRRREVPVDRLDADVEPAASRVPASSRARQAHEKRRRSPS